MATFNLKKTCPSERLPHMESLKSQTRDPHSELLQRSDQHESWFSSFSLIQLQGSFYQ